MAKRRKRTKRKKANRQLLFAPLILILVGLGFWYAKTAFEDRVWKEYREAGLRAHARGNYSYAVKMHEKALVEAEELGLEKRSMTLRDLARAHLGAGNRRAAVEIQYKLRSISKNFKE